MTGCKNVLGFVTCHSLSENTIEDVSEVMTVGQQTSGEKGKKKGARVSQANLML